MSRDATSAVRTTAAPQRIPTAIQRDRKRGRKRASAPGNAIETVNRRRRDEGGEPNQPAHLRASARSAARGRGRGGPPAPSSHMRRPWSRNVRSGRARVRRVNRIGQRRDDSARLSARPTARPSGSGVPVCDAWGRRPCTGEPMGPARPRREHRRQKAASKEEQRPDELDRELLLARSDQKC